jgi:type I restriction enzyme S subunit
MTQKSKPLRAFVSSCETQKEEAKPALVPKLRFPEFRGAEGWAERPLKAVAQMNPANDGLPESFIYIDLESVEAGKLKAKNRISREGAPSRAQRLVDHGDIIFQVVRPYQRNNLLCEFEDDEDYVASTGYAQLRAKGSNHFLYQSIHTDSFVGRVMAKCTGSNYPAINSSDLAEIHLPLPHSPAEQQKIAECLSSVDEVIAAQARKVEALKTHKKGLMQQLFPGTPTSSSASGEKGDGDVGAPSETQPRLRFPEFQNAGAWEDDTLGAVCEIYQPVTLSSSELSMTGEHLVYGANGVIGTHNEYNHEESEIAVTCRGATCGEVTTTKPKSWITGNAMVVKPRSKRLRKDFIFHYFKNHGLKTVISGSAQPQITRTGFAPLVIFFPEPAEQHRIAACLSSLDALIAAETQKHAALQRHKRGLMQQLFPSPEPNEE